MKVAFDYQIFSEHEYGGISRYFYSLAAALSALPGVQPRILSPLHVNAYLQHAPAGLVSGWPVRSQRGTRRLILGTSGVLFRSAVAMFQPDIVHETYYRAQPTSRTGARSVLTVFDMIHERCPEHFAPDDRTAAIKAAAIHRADHLFCISEYTRRDLIAIHGVPEQKITVTCLATDPLPVPGRSARSLMGGTPYLLHVGGRNGYKNFSGFLRAYATSPWLRENFRIVCFGSGGLTATERTLIAALGLPEAAIVPLGGGDELLAALYQGAAALVYPSLYEGFGIPPLEAMAQGCPVICSRTTSIPEVVGEAGAYFDPADFESIREAIERTLQSSTLRASLMAAGKTRCQQFSWARCARETLSAYREVRS